MFLKEGDYGGVFENILAERLVSLIPAACLFVSVDAESLASGRAPNDRNDGVV